MFGISLFHIFKSGHPGQDWAPLKTLHNKMNILQNFAICIQICIVFSFILVENLVVGHEDLEALCMKKTKMHQALSPGLIVTNGSIVRLQGIQRNCLDKHSFHWFKDRWYVLSTKLHLVCHVFNPFLTHSCRHSKSVKISTSALFAEKKQHKKCVNPSAMKFTKNTVNDYFSQKDHLF